MLEDRDYMRQPVYRELRVSFTAALLVVNAIVFLVECVACGYPPVFSTGNFFALSVEGLKHGFVWQLLTYQFMHAGLLHIFLNCWVIYVFGREIEKTLGPQKFLALFFASGVIGGLLQSGIGWILPDYFGGATVGASAGAFGLVAAYAILFPERELALIFPPMILRAKTLLIFSAVLALLSIAWGIAFPISNIANAAHLGGMLTGVFFALQFSRGHWPQWQFPSRSTPSRKSKNELSTDEFVKNEVDPILDKISTHGIQSLTAREREILEKARTKIEKH